jgi:hypothetical protein
MPPPQGVSAARQSPSRTGPPPDGGGPTGSAEPASPGEQPADESCAADRRPRLLTLIHEANELSAFNRRSRGAGL